MNRETLGDRLVQVLDEQHVSQAELARRVGVKQQTIQKLCTNRSARSAYVAEIARALNISAYWLATGAHVRQPWGSIGADARLVAAKYEELPPHGQRQLQDHLEYLRKRFPPGSPSYVVIADDC